MPITEEMYALFATNFGHRVKARREECQKTQGDLADEIGVSKTTIQNYEAGNIPKGLYLFKLSRALKCSIDYLMIGEESPYIQEDWVIENPSGMNNEKLAEYNETKKSWLNSKSHDNGLLDEEPEVAELLEGARRVLKSGNPIAFDALERNIRYFDHAVATEKRLKSMEEKLEHLNSVEAKLEELMKLLAGKELKKAGNE